MDPLVQDVFKHDVSGLIIYVGDKPCVVRHLESYHLLFTVVPALLVLGRPQQARIEASRGIS